MNLEKTTIDIFCRVVDNFGDIGVCWRLAQSLPKECSIRLWVDDLKSFNKIEPAVNSLSKQQYLKGIEIRHWQEPIDYTQTADLVIEAFSCDLPQRYIDAMRNNTKCWLNLDYLSAEKWVEDFHLLPSIQANNVPKYFFYPGFNEKTGGLLRHHKALQDKNDFLKKLLPKTSYDYYQQNNPLLVNLFCYPHAPIEALLKSFTKEQKVMIVLAESVAPQLERIATQLNSEVYIQRLNFIVQEDYDCLLQAADINLIRGEDSFVQAHWAAKPMLWHIYPQTEEQHLIKLEAWLDAINAPQWLRQLNQLWNVDLTPTQQQSFIELMQHHATQAVWSEFQKTLSERLNTMPSLSQQIMNFYVECAKKS